MRKLFSILTSCLMLLTLILPAYAAGEKTLFSDIKGHWAAQVIVDMTKRGIVHGFEDGTFRPDDLITRAQFLTLLIRCTGLKAEGTDPVQMPTKSDVWYAEALEAAVAHGLIEKDLPFQVNELIPRQEMAKLAVKALYAKAGPIILTQQYIIFKDEEEVGEGYMPFLQDAFKLRIMQGYDGYMRPMDLSTRAEGLMVIHNVEKALQQIQASQ